MPMFDQENSQGIAIFSPSEPHLACLLLFDTSASMINAAIEDLNNAIIAFKADACADEFTQKRVDVAIVEFNDVARVVQPFVPIGKMEPVRLQATGCTSMGAGINLAIDLVKERKRLYAQMGTPYYAPWIVMITDGAPTDDPSMAAQRIISEEAKGALKFWSVGLTGCDFKALVKLSRKRRIIELTTTDYKKLFRWLLECMTVNLEGYPVNNRMNEIVEFKNLLPEIRAVAIQNLDDDWLDE